MEFQMNQTWFESQEEQDQVRLTWNRFPSSDVLDEANQPLPMAALYTPFARPIVPLKTESELHYCPCGAIFNIYCSVSPEFWQCNFCGRNNPSMLIMSLTEPASTEEYQVRPTETEDRPSTLVFIVDTCTTDSELKHLVDKLKETASQLDPETLVSLLTIANRSVSVHNLSGENNPTLIVFDFQEETADQIKETIIFTEYYMQPISTCLDELSSQLDKLITSHSANPRTKRVSRPTGKALFVAINLLENDDSFNPQGRILLFASGPCTEGPGQVTNDDLKKTMRTFGDIENNKAAYFNRARDFYDKMAARAMEKQHIIDVFISGDFRDVGLYEMSCCAEKTGGLVVKVASYSSNTFELNLHAAMLREPIGENAFIKVITSRGLKLRNNDDNLRIVPNATLEMYFDVQRGRQNGFGFIQFKTTYGNRIRVTTIRRHWIDPVQYRMSFLNGLDPLAAGVITARLALKTINPFSWLTKVWSDWLLKQRRAGSTNQFTNSPHMLSYKCLLDQMMQLPLIKNSLTSPDEAAVMRFMFNRLNVNESMSMLRPITVPRSFLTPDDPRQLNVLDLYYRVLIYHDFPPQELQNIREYVTTALSLQSRVPVPEIIDYYRSPEATKTN